MVAVVGYGTYFWWVSELSGGFNRQPLSSFTCITVGQYALGLVLVILDSVGFRNLASRYVSKIITVRRAR